MVHEVILNDAHIKVTKYEQEMVKDDATGKDLNKITFHFKVNGGKDYHDVTVLLYENIFDVKVPDTNLHFRGKISSYSTSIADFSDASNVADFTLQLTEVSGNDSWYDN